MSDLQALLNVLRGGNFVVLDTETTGLNEDAQIVQLAIISDTGNTLIDTLVKPTCHIPPSASIIHGITDEMVQDAPPWGNVTTQLMDAIKDRPIVIYNAEYDTRLLIQTYEAHRIMAEKVTFQAVCAMMGYAEHNGDWNDYYNNYRWVKLDHACRQMRIPVVNAHNALGDCQMTLALCKALLAHYERTTP